MSATVQLQIFVSLVVVLGAAFVALVCDFLKGNNEHLREQNRELRARKEEAERRLLGLEAVARESSLLSAGNSVTKPLVRAGLQAPATPAAHASAEPVGVATGLANGRRRPRKSAAELSESIKEIASWVAVNGPSLEKPAAARETRIAMAAPVQITPVVADAPAETKPAKQEVPAATADPLAAAERAHDVWPEIVIKFGEARQALEARKMENDPVRAAAANTSRRTGIQDASVLEGELAARKNFRGLVMIVGINDYEALRTRREFRKSEVDWLFESQLENKYLACRTGDGEIVFLFDGVTGQQARSRSTGVSESLWDFQLRHIGSFMIDFSWGAYESAGEPLGVCLENARDEMRSTRRGRFGATRSRTLTQQKAVNL